MHAERLGLGQRRVHLRGLHYMMVAGEVAKPDGLPYTNTEEDWTWLVMHAAKAARFLGYIPFAQIVDARNAEPVVNDSIAFAWISPIGSCSSARRRRSMTS